jgi:hypothetical protein
MQIKLSSGSVWVMEIPQINRVMLQTRTTSQGGQRNTEA